MKSSPLPFTRPFARAFKKMPVPVALKKAFRLVSLFPIHPQEFWDRVAAIIQVKMQRSNTYKYSTLEWGQLIAQLKDYYGSYISDFEQELTEVARGVQLRIQNLRPNMPFSLRHNADLSLAHLCYIATRAIQPQIIIETGVAHGVSSTFILQALSINNKGILHSIDLPPLARNADKSVGILIPEKLKQRWQLHRGVSKRLLPGLLHKLGRCDLFLHDSLHTYQNMRREFDQVTPYLRQGSILLSDDVQNNRAFYEWASLQTNLQFWATIQSEEKGVFGIAALKRTILSSESESS